MAVDADRRHAAATRLRDALTAVQGVIQDATASDWLRQVLAAAVERDSIDAANDAERLADLLAELAAARLEASAAGLLPGEGRP